MKRAAINIAFVLAVLLVADLVGAELTERGIARDVRDTSILQELPETEVTGFPFLTQAFAGRFEEIKVWATDVPTGELVLAQLEITLTGVRLPLTKAVTGDTDRIPVDRVTARAVVPYAQLAQRADVQTLTIEPVGEQRVRVFGAVEVLGQTLSASAVSRIEAVDGQIVITAEEFDVGNRTVNRVLTSALRGVFDFQVPVRGLPYGLTVTEVDLLPDGLEVRSVATDTIVGVGAG